MDSIQNDIVYNTLNACLCFLRTRSLVLIALNMQNSQNPKPGTDCAKHAELSEPAAES